MRGIEPKTRRMRTMEASKKKLNIKPTRMQQPTGSPSPRAERVSASSPYFQGTAWAARALISYKTSRRQKIISLQPLAVIME